MVGKVCNVDYILAGKAVVTILSEEFVNFGVAPPDFHETIAEIIDTSSGDVVLRAIVEQSPKEKLHREDIIGKALADAIKKELTPHSQR